MKGMILKKAFLLGGIFLLSTFMLAQFSWSCDDDKDKWDCDHHDKWDCHKHGKPCQPPRIQRVFLEYKPAPDTSEPFIRFSIWGKNFDNGVPPVVTLGGEFDLTVTRYSHDYVQATLPLSAEEDFDYGDYRLVVSTCHDSRYNHKYCKDHGPKCKCKYCKDHCSKYKDKYCKDNEYRCRCKDRYSLTIANPQGQAAPPGIPGYERNEFRSQITFPFVVGNKAEVPCSSANKRLLGGGGGIISFVVPSESSPDHFYAIYNGPGPEPRPDGREAWVIKWKYDYEYETTIDIAIYAICADVSD